MALTGALGLFRGKPLHPVGPGGQMALTDHFRELRARLMRSVLTLIVALVVALFFYDNILALLTDPYNQAREVLGRRVDSRITVNGVGGPLMLQLKVCGVAALVASAPVWLYQIWAFILPGLHRNEKKWTLIFVSIASPLFFAGVWVGYYVMPKGLQVLIGFTQNGFQNLVEFNEFFSFFVRTLLVFGIAFEIPLFVILLNLAGILPGRVLGQYRPWIIVGVFIFAAVATPSTDPFSMCMLAFPMTLLFLISEVIARLVDRARGKKTAAKALSPDEASPL